MITITDLQTNKEVSLEECAKEHGMEVPEGTSIVSIVFYENLIGIDVYSTVFHDTRDEEFNSSRFKLEITNE